MDDLVNSIEKQLKDLSIFFIDYFDTLKKFGAISQEEYDKHTSVKKKFLNSIDDGKSKYSSSKN